MKVSKSGVEVVFLVLIQASFLHIREVVLFFEFTAIVVNIRDVIVVDVDKGFASVYIDASEFFKFDPFLVFGTTYRFYNWKNFALFFV